MHAVQVGAGLALLAMTSPAAAQQRPSVAPKSMHQVAPALADYTDQTLFGDVWARPELRPRDRSLVTLSALISTGKAAQLSGHTKRALTNGVKPVEIAGLVTHLAFYSGWPNAVSALEVIEKAFSEAEIAMPIDQRAAASGAPNMPREANPQMTALAPKFEQLTAEVIFDSLWRRSDLAPRDRSLITIAALAANGDERQLASHVARGLAHGLRSAEIIEAMTHLAFYAGWARANSALRVAGEVFAKEGEMQSTPPPAGERLKVFAPGKDPAPGPASNFTGAVTAASRFKGSGDSRLGGATVSFRPGARTNWHSHPLGQLLIITAGRGWVQAEGEPARAVGPGDVVWTAPGARHWHGATRSSAMTHVAVSEALDGKTVTWAEPVPDQQYDGPK